MKNFFDNFPKSPYDYRDAVKQSICYSLQCDYGLTPAIIKKMTKDAFFKRFYDNFFVKDSVTGNASGSFFYDSYKAECCLFGNSDLLNEALTELGEPTSRNAESSDVTIRCYLLSECLTAVYDDCKNGKIKRF